MLKKFLILSTSVVMFCGIGLAGGDVPPEVTPRVKEKVPTPVSEEDGVNTPTPTPKPQKADCGPQVSDMVEGKCLCSKTQCPTCQACTACKKTKCPVSKPKKCPEVKPQPCPSCPEPQVREVSVEKRVPDDTAYDRWTIYAGAGQGPEGFDPVLYKERSGTNEYRAYKDYGDVFGGAIAYKFTRRFSVMGSYTSNETKMIYLGLSF